MFFLSLLLVLLPPPSLFYSLKNCTADFYDQTKIDCTKNDLTTIPSDIPKSATLITLTKNRIQTIRQTDLRGFTQLKTLRLRNNHISLIEDGAFIDLSSLTHLNLAANNLENLTDNMFKGLSNLIFLDLSFNLFRNISKFVFEPLNSLEELYMSEKNPVDLTNIISHTPSIRILSGDVQSFEDKLCPFPLLNLTTLQLDDSSLKKFSVHSNVLPQ
uniref:Uncharacterized protein n=1 Tax=Periophthalmus magnuspinnatus TaxID=409849 RepID=A0A3B4A9I5_9GOBI